MLVYLPVPCLSPVSSKVAFYPPVELVSMPVGRPFDSVFLPVPVDFPFDLVFLLVLVLRRKEPESVCPPPGYWDALLVSVFPLRGWDEVL